MKKKKVIKAYIRFYGSDIKPTILWEKPTKKDFEIDKKFEVRNYPCKIIY